MEEYEDNNFERVKDFVKNKQAKKIFDEVFDKETLDTILELARKKYFEEVEFVISTGKEGHVFRCRSTNNYYALKIYKIETSDFKHMSDYIIGDERFKDVRKDKFEIVKAWTKKEFRNLDELSRARVRVPLPIASKRNCLIMEFIGDENGEPAKRAKEKPFKNMQEKYELVCNYMAKMIKKKIVHADLSEYNILNNNEELVIIDVGQAVSTLHPKAKEFFERDVKNMSRWFAKHGVDTNYKKMYADIKAKK